MPYFLLARSHMNAQSLGICLVLGLLLGLVHAGPAVVCKDTSFFETCHSFESFSLDTSCVRLPPHGPICNSQYCPQNCSGHGSCIVTQAGVEVKCACSSGFTGSHCDTQLCPEDCSGHGLCHPTEKKCICEPGFGGSACSDRLCSNQCKFHGTCNFKTGVCECDIGYTGQGCTRAPQELYIKSWSMVVFVVLMLVCLILAFLVNMLPKLQILPSSIIAMGVGIIAGIIVQIYQLDVRLYFLHQSTIFLICLPLILFEAGFSLQKDHFFHNLGSILLFAVVGTIISTVVVATCVYYLGQWGVVAKLEAKAALIFGAIVSAIDPVATLAIFQALKVDTRLYMLSFGESVLNDAVAIVLFQTFLSLFYVQGLQLNIYDTGSFFMIAFFGSVGIGIASACTLAIILKFVFDGKQQLAVEVGLLALFAYLPYVLCASLQLSGIMAIVSCGVTMAHYTVYNMSHAARLVADGMSQTLAFVCDTFLFAYIGLCLTLYDYSASWSLAVWSIFLVCPIARALNIFPLAGLVNLFRANPIPLKYQVIMWFSGMRGMIAFVLALNVPGDDNPIIVPAVLMIVGISVVVFGGGTLPMMELVDSVADKDDPLKLKAYEALVDERNFFEVLDHRFFMPLFRRDDDELRESEQSRPPQTVPTPVPEGE